MAVISQSLIATASLLCCVSSGNAIAGSELYVTYGSDGTPQFATQPYDASYTPYRREQTRIPIKKDIPPRRSRTTEPRSEMTSLIQEAARKQGLDPSLVSAIIAVESGFNPNAVSPKGAVGAMQLIPKTAAQYGVTDSRDLQQNLSGGTRYLKDLIVAYNGNLPLVLAAYNAGQTNVSRHNRRIPPFNETMLYVPKVLAKMEEFRRQNELLPQ